MVKDAESESVRPAEPARTANALMKRAEQLKRWEESETNKENFVSKGSMAKKVKFPEGCVFLAACASGDIDEVELLLEQGADINTTNVDGLTALHQAVIDQNLDMVQFLIDNNADIDSQDNEGWTPLMAGISCNFMDIVRLLLDKNADVALLNNDGELPLDLAETDEMRSLIESEIRRRGINLEEARNREETLMLRDAIEWSNSPKITREKRHPKTGATPLHVAAAKGYIKVMSILLQAGADVNSKDIDGWTPLHAAAHWCERQACELLVENMCNIEEKNLLGQTCFVVADPEIVSHLESLKKKQEAIKEKRPSAERSDSATSNRTILPYNKRKNSVTRTSTGDKMRITKVDEVKEAEVLRASSSEASDNDEDQDNEDEEETSKLAMAEKKRSDSATLSDAKAETSVNEANGISVLKDVVPPLSKPNVIVAPQPSSVIISTPAEPATSTVTSIAPCPLASVSVTVQQPPSVSRSSLTSSTVKPDVSAKITALQKQFGPPVIIPSSVEAPAPPSWRLTGRRISASGVASPPQSPTVLSAVQSSLTTTAPSASTVTSTSVVASTPEVVRWRKRSDVAEVASAANAEDKNFFAHPKFPWLRSASSPSIRFTTSPTIVKPTSLSLASPNASTVENRAAAVGRSSSLGSSPVLPFATNVFPLATSVSLTGTAERQSRKAPSITLPLTVTRPQSPSMVRSGGFPQQQITQPSSVAIVSPPVRGAIPSVGGQLLKANNSAHATSTPNLSPIKENFASRSFTPPQRGDESEAERKARAKRERETRRSTQGITLEAVKAAEQLYTDRNKKTPDDAPKANDTTNPVASTTQTSVTTIEITSPTKFNNSSYSKLIAAKTNDETSSKVQPKVWERASTAKSASVEPVKETAAVAPNNVSSVKNLNTYSPYPWRTTRVQIAGDSNVQQSQPVRPVQFDEQQQKVPAAENDSSDKSAIQGGVLNRRRTRPNRRSTGPIAQDDIQLAIENDDVEAADENNRTGSIAEETKSIVSLTNALNSVGSRFSSSDDSTKTSATERSKPTNNLITTGPSVDFSNNLSGYRNNRYPLLKVGSNFSERSTARATSGIGVGSNSNNNGLASQDLTEIDYKKLYEKEKSENDRMRDVIVNLEKLVETMKLSSKASGDGSHIIGYDTRLERRVSELEEENKILEQIKADNQRLKEENGALIRVISKLSKSK